jgi:hypothetical protein
MESKAGYRRCLAYNGFQGLDSFSLSPRFLFRCSFSIQEGGILASDIRHKNEGDCRQLGNESIVAVCFA